MTNVSLLTDEIASNYTSLTGRTIATPEEYLLFREQALKEVNCGSFVCSRNENAMQPTQLSATSKNQNDAEMRPVITEKSSPVSHYSKEYKQDVSKAHPAYTPHLEEESTDEDDNFFACISRLDD